MCTGIVQTDDFAGASRPSRRRAALRGAIGPASSVQSVDSGVSRAVSSHESATLWGGGGHFWGRIARLATRQGLLGLSSRRVQAFGLKGLGLRVHGLGFKIGVMPEAHRGAHAARCTRRDARAVTLCTPRTCQEQLPHVLPLLRFSL